MVHHEIPHNLADYCSHAGVGKACRYCARLANAASREAIGDVVKSLRAVAPNSAVLTAADAIELWMNMEYPEENSR